jgi:hypothetical protein
MELKLDLTIDEINVVLMGLGQVAYIQSAPVIDKIENQVNAQIEEMNNKDV